jgi:hypothetical protein
MTDQQNSPQLAENALHRAASRDRQVAGKITEVLAELDAELRDLAEHRNEIGPDVFSIGVDAWAREVERVLGRLEFPSGEIDELLQSRMSRVAAELGITPRPLRARRV